MVQAAVGEAYGTRPALHDGHQWHSTAQPYSTAQCRGRLRRAAPARRSKDGVVADLRVQKLLCHSRAILHGVFTSRLLRRSVQNAAQRGATNDRGEGGSDTGRDLLCGAHVIIEPAGRVCRQRRLHALRSAAAHGHCVQDAVYATQHAPRTTFQYTMHHTPLVDSYYGG